MQVTFKVRNVSGLFFLGIISGFITGLSIQLPTFRSTELFPFCAIVFSTIMALYATSMSDYIPPGAVWVSLLLAPWLFGLHFT